MNDKTKEDLLDVVEEQDGSATVDLPDNLAVHDDDDDVGAFDGVAEGVDRTPARGQRSRLG